MCAKYGEWDTLLREHFGDYTSTTNQSLWDSVRAKLSIGDQTNGTVISKAPFGAWIDIDEGFPGLLEIISIKGLTPENYQSDDWCPIGSDVTATIAGFRDNSFQINLAQDVYRRRIN